VAPTIARISKEAGCDLIVMGTRARHPLVELVAGAVTARVRRASDVPVVLVKRNAARPASIAA
jgi:nucleotide-binding universal stress UspA family protein